MDIIIKEISNLIDEMEAIIGLDSYECEDEEKLKAFWHEVRDKFIEYEGFDGFNQIKQRFHKVCNEFDTPEDIEEYINDMMFPDEESKEGFDMDKFNGLT
jgi:hypothetical protein